MVRMNRLNDIVMRQQQKLDIQHELMLTKEKRLEVLRDAGKLHAVEAKVRSLRSRREAVEDQENRNAMLRVELDRLAGLFRQKQTDLNALMQRVEVLAGQLDELERSSGYVQQLRERLEKKRASNEGFENGCQPGCQPLKYRNTLPPNSRINRPFTAVVSPQPRNSDTGTSIAIDSNTVGATPTTSTDASGLGFAKKVGNFKSLNCKDFQLSTGLLEATPITSTGKPEKSKKKDKSRRVSFDPLALLLDAALEGELDLVARIVSSTTKPHNDDKNMQPIPMIDRGNDEGITALHNAICASHLPVVLYLIEAGCDVNAQDADGWTPLHCAASCNNARVAKALVEAGACVYAMTHADKETPLDKCERQEPGFDECFELLMSAQNRLDGHVHAMFAYEKENEDELSYKQDDALTILRRGDGKEREWYWCQAESTGEEGYVARNLLASYPRKPRTSDVDIDDMIESIAVVAAAPKDSIVSPYTEDVMEGGSNSKLGGINTSIGTFSYDRSYKENMLVVSNINNNGNSCTVSNPNTVHQHLEDTTDNKNSEDN